MTPSPLDPFSIQNNNNNNNKQSLSPKSFPNNMTLDEHWRNLPLKNVNVSMYMHMYL